MAIHGADLNEQHRPIDVHVTDQIETSNKKQNFKIRQDGNEVYSNQVSN